jgi:hypothetical protein
MNFIASVEPEWMQNIPSTVICQYFFVIFVIVAALASLVVASDVMRLLSPKNKGGLFSLMRSLVMLALPVVNALFLYILCSRSLLEGGGGKK